MSEELVRLPVYEPVRIVKWHVKAGSKVYHEKLLLTYQMEGGPGPPHKFNAAFAGVVKELLVKENAVLPPTEPIMSLSETSSMDSCPHATIFRDLCADCGLDLRNDPQYSRQASVAMVHSVPELLITSEQAEHLGREDELRLLRDKKLVLLVDLDQTLIHTTNDNIPNNMKDVFHFQLYGPRSPWYHTRLRPGTNEFLKSISTLYELHICTFGARMYAHTIAGFLDPKQNIFSHRILSRDECFNHNTKTANIKSLFPCGDHMVCIIDDREDVWNFVPNLVHVKPYHFFQHTGDINAPPGLAKKERDNRQGFNYEPIKIKESKKDENTSKTDAAEKEPQDKEGKEESSSKTKVNAESDKAAESSKVVVNGEEDKGEAARETETEAEDADDYLLHLEDILKMIHRTFYKKYEEKKEAVPDLKELIPGIRGDVLKGVNLVFSGVVPHGVPLNKSKPYCIAKGLGANVSDKESGEESEESEGPSARTRSESGDSSFSDSINPLLAMSKEQREIMGKEVESCLETDSDDESNVEVVSKKRKIVEEESSSEESLTGEYPHGGWKPRQTTRKEEDDDINQTHEDTTETELELPSVKFRRGEGLPSDLDMGESRSEESDDAEWDEIGADLEREFLGS